MTRQPDSIDKLAAAYGGPSQAAFGSAVFHDKLPANTDLTRTALDRYRYFAGKLWNQYGEAAWMETWKEVHVRDSNSKPDIVTELRNIADSTARQSIPMFLDAIKNPETAASALSGAFDDPAVNDLRVFTIGDGGAMSGILIAALRKGTGEATCLVFLMD